ncbi:hypothetical protein [Frondihabitans australicus]|uniref:hypothetical protein n=1 Tax=Frondihabitans australicus TaxID=386892 RepID=UPI000EB4674E|nr:hypothetical protein [Frondihabitans australicus]
MPRIPLRRVALEAAGVALAAAWGLVAIAHALAGAKRDLLLDDGDSVLLPLIVRSFREGLPNEWGMSPVLFVFPELPLYLVSATVTTGVAAALLLNGVLNVVLLYGLLRVVAGRVTALSGGVRRRGHGRAVTGALVGTGGFAILCLLETRPGGNTGEIMSLYLTTTYYAGTVMALVAATALVVHLLAGGRRIGGAAGALALLSALATLSNPLYALWVTGPVLVTALVVACLRSRFRRPLLTLAAVVVGSGIGYAARLPLGPYLIAQKDEYLRWQGRAESAQFYGDAFRVLVQTVGGRVEVGVWAGLILLSVVGAVLRLRRRRDDAAGLVALLAIVTVVVVAVGLNITGSLATRYALPIVFSPLVSLAATVASADWRALGRRTRDRLPLTRVGSRRAGSRRAGSQEAGSPQAVSRLRAGGLRVAAGLGAAVVVATLVAAVPSTASVVAAGSASGEPAARCLTDWSRGKDATGVAQFWTVRGLQTYGGDDVHLLQVNSDLSVYPWLTNLAAYRHARVGYVIVATGEIPGGHTEGWADTVTALGTPRDTVHCDGYDIVDFRGTPAQKALTSAVVDSADAQAALRGFEW